MEHGHQILLAQSFAKVSKNLAFGLSLTIFLQNLGLYGERIGTFSMVCRNKEEKERVQSQVKRVIRPLYSSPPMQRVGYVGLIACS